MGITSFTVEITSPLPAATMFKANVLKGHELCPKLMPQIITGSTIVQGDGGVGSIKQINFVDDVTSSSFIKLHIDALDAEKFECTLSLIEGGGVGSKLESATFHIQVLPISDGGSVYKVFSEYKFFNGLEYNEDELEKLKNGMIGMFKDVEGHIVANPHY